MDFILQREFFHPHINTKMKRKNAADNVKYS
jgi:WD40 repeat protein